MRTCRTCLQVKALEEFPRHPRARSGRDTRCRDCSNIYKRGWYERNRERQRALQKVWRAANGNRKRDKDRVLALRKKYGIAIDEYRRLLAAQGGGCAICHRTPDAGGRWFSVDHDHTTGRIRGILCPHCNSSLGGFEDNPVLLRAAIEYLDAPPFRGDER